VNHRILIVHRDGTTSYIYDVRPEMFEAIQTALANGERGFRAEGAAPTLWLFDDIRAMQLEEVPE